MLRTTRLAGLAVVASAFAMLAGGSSAMAAGADVYACSFAGLAGNLNPGVYSVSHTVTALASLQLPPDHGTFDFTTNGAPLPSVCAGVRVNSDLGIGAGVATVAINAGGTYDNLVCGTGLAQGVGNTAATAVLAQVGTPPPLSANAPFTIAFVAGNGALAITGASNSEGSGGAGAGYVNIVPDALTPGAGDCVLSDVKQFRVTGGFTAAIPVV